MKVDNFDAKRAQPFDTTLKVAALANDDRSKTKLPDKSAAIPARRQGGYENQVAIGALAAGVSESVGLSVHGRVSILHPPIMASAEKLSVRIKDRSANRDTAFFQTLSGFR